MKKLLVVSCWLLVAFAAFADAPKPEILTVNPNGSFSNTNVVGNLAGFAEAKAQSQIAEGIAQAAHTASTNTERIVREGIDEIQAGAKIEYSDVFVWSAGAFALSTNATCNTYKMVMHPEVTTNISGEAHIAVDISYWFSEDIGSYQPGIKYASNLNATNSWTMCAQDEPIGPFADTTPQGMTVENAYRTRNWIPKSLQSAFFKVFVDSAAPGTGMTIDIIGKIKGGFTGSLVVQLMDGRWLYIDVDGGVVTGLMISEVGP